MSIKYFLYARKSTEDEERQIMSIEAQLTELQEFAKRENIIIAKTFIESKSAKRPSPDAGKMASLCLLAGQKQKTGSLQVCSHIYRGFTCVFLVGLSCLVISGQTQLKL